VEKVRRICKLLVIITIFFFLTLSLIVVYFSFKDYTDYFQSRRGKLDQVTEKYDSASNKIWLTLKNSEGFKVEAGLLIPRKVSEKYPAAILLGGKATGKYAINYAFDIDNVIIIALDYPYEPRESYDLLTIIRDLPAVRSAIFDMIPSAMLAIDYLYKRGDVDTNRLMVIGYSFGAPFVPVIMANDNRADAAVIVYGGGELSTLIEHNVARYKSKYLARFLGFIGGLFLNPLEPLRYIDRIAPKPLLMVSGSNDEQIPRHNTEVLFNKAKEPKKIVWIESKHVNPRNEDLTRKILATLKRELEKMGMLKNM